MTIADTRPGTVVLLHGHGDDPDSVRSVGSAVAPAGWRVSVPHGPAITTGSRRAWWRSDVDGAPVAGDVDDAIAVVDDVLAGLAGAGPVVLGGFSQGGALALALAVSDRAPTSPLAGAFAVGAWLPDLVAVPTDLAAAAAHAMPVLIAHGTDDDDVPLLLGRSAARLLDRHDVPVTFVSLDVGHDLSAFTATVTDWLAAVARGERPRLAP